MVDNTKLVAQAINTSQYYTLDYYYVECTCTKGYNISDLLVHMYFIMSIVKTQNIWILLFVFEY